MTKSILRSCSLLAAAVCSGPLWSVTVTITNIDQPSCGFNNGSLHANVAGGLPPYDILWSNGSSQSTIAGLAPGTYSVSVTDGLGNTDTDEVTIAMVNTGMNGLTVTSSLPDCNQYCIGSVELNISALQGTFPFTFDPEPSSIIGNGAHFGGLCDGNLYLTITDANGCSGALNYWAGHIYGADLEIIDQSDACGGSANGAFVVEVQDQSGFGFGEHCVTVTEQIGGAVIEEFELVNYGELLTVEDLAPGTYSVTTITCNAEGQQLCPGDFLEVTIGNAAPPCGNIHGTVYHDANEDCIFEGSDLPQPYRVIAIDPIGSFAISDALGNYQQSVPYGNFDILYSQAPNEIGICPTGTPQPITIDQFNDDVTLDFANLSTIPHDILVNIWSGPARPGFRTWIHATVSNTTAFPSGIVTLSIDPDPLLTDLSEPDGQWELGVIPPYSSVGHYLYSTVPADIDLLGTALTYTAIVTNTATESTLVNNSSSLDVVITGSYDPNDKRGVANISRSGTQFFLGTDEWIDYTVRFQNTGTDTAFTVVIRDEIEEDLDVMSLEILGASHAFTPSFGEGRELVFTFNDILLPDSTTDLLGSQGFVAFRLKPHMGLVPGDIIENIANIYFDFNPPVITEPSVLNVVSPIRLDARAWLGGAYDVLATQMRDDLRSQALMPLTEPYTTLGYTHSGAGGGETIGPSLLAITGPTAIVDWVLLELRSTAQPTTVLHSRAALLRRDGRITDKDGTSPVAFAAPVGSYRVALRHRNHLGVISAAPIALGSSATTWDIRTTTTALFGTAPTIVDGTTRLLWPGDGNRDGIVRYAGAANDRDPLLQAIGGQVPTTVVNNTYSPLDINLDGTLRYVGAANDRDIILQTIGGTVPTAVRMEQVP